MDAIATTISYMKSMPVNDQKRVMSFATHIVNKKETHNPYAPITEEQVLSDLALSDQQYHECKTQDAREAITEMRRHYGFI